MFICMLSIISGKFESRKFLVFQHLSSIVQIFHTQLKLSVEKILNNLQSCSFWLYKSNRQHRNSTSIVPNWNSWPSGIFLFPFIWHTRNQFVWRMKNEQICDVSVMCMSCHHVRSHVDVMSVLFVCDAIMLCCISVYCHHIMLHLGWFRNFWEPLLKYENVVFNGEQKICVRIR